MFVLYGQGEERENPVGDSRNCWLISGAVENLFSTVGNSQQFKLSLTAPYYAI